MNNENKDALANAIREAFEMSTCYADFLGLITAKAGIELDEMLEMQSALSKDS
jgi:hypothetical protein